MQCLCPQRRRLAELLSCEEWTEEHSSKGEDSKNVDMSVSLLENYLLCLVRYYYY